MTSRPYRLFERFLAPYARWHQGNLAADRAGVVRQPGGRAGAQHRAPHGPQPGLVARGRVSGLRLKHLLARIDALPPGLLRIVVALHPLLAPQGEVSRQVAGGARRALTAFAAHGVRLVLAGHLHRSYGPPRHA